MDTLGVTTRDGLTIVARTWTDRLLDDDMHWQEVRRVNQQMLEDVVGLGLASADATSRDAATVVEQWGFPMGSLDLTEKEVDREALKDQQENWSPD